MGNEKDSRIISDEGLQRTAQSIDHLINVDIGARGSSEILFEAARELTGGTPLTLAAVRLLQKAVHPGEYVFIATGWAEQPSHLPTKGETDGPVGAAALARAIRLSRKGLPVILTDDYMVTDLERVMTGAGFSIAKPQDLPLSLCEDYGFCLVPTVAVVGFPKDRKACRALSEKLLAQLCPSACISIERGALNRQGRIHVMGGLDCAETQAKLDEMFLLASEKGIATIGIGDGGNEIGMANIEKTVRQKIRYGNLCRCPCQKGIAPDVTRVDVLVTAAVSNWGGSAIACLLGLAEGNPDAMWSEALENRTLGECWRAGLHDSLGASVAPGADGCGEEISCAVIRLIRKIIEMGIRSECTAFSHNCL